MLLTDPWGDHDVGYKQ